MGMKLMAQIGGALALLLALAGCTDSNGSSLPASPAVSSEVTPTATLSAAPTASAPTVSASSPAVAEVALSFTPVTSEQQIERTTGGDNPSDIVLQQPVIGGTVLIYAKLGDEENAYAQYRMADARYELGIVGGLPRQPDNEGLSVTELQLFGQSIVRINGVFGANAPVHNYFALGDGGIKPFLLVDTGHAEEIDIDGDGITEIVATHGTPMQTYIYKFADGRFTMANVNEALGAISVYLDGENLFEAQFKLNSKVVWYKYNQGKLIFY